MVNFKKLFEEKNIHFAFEVGVMLKGVHAVIEIIGGISLFFISQRFITQTLYSITQAELIEDPRDFIAHYLVNTAAHLTAGSQYFAAFYLLSHGILKMFLVVNLLKEKLWAYPVSLVIFGGFIFYQIFRFTITHSSSLLLITALDLIVILLTWHEYRYKKNLLLQREFERH